MKATGHTGTPEAESGVEGPGALRVSPNALRVLKKRYLAKDENGKVIETPEGMFRRVAHNLAQADALYGATPEEVRTSEEEFCRDGPPGLSAEFSDPHERLPAAAAAGRLFRPAGRGLDHGNLRYVETPGAHPPDRRGGGGFFLPVGGPYRRGGGDRGG